MLKHTRSARRSEAPGVGRESCVVLRRPPAGDRSWRLLLPGLGGAAIGGTRGAPPWTAQGTATGMEGMPATEPVRSVSLGQWWAAAEAEEAVGRTGFDAGQSYSCLLYTSPSPRDS